MADEHTSTAPAHTLVFGNEKGGTGKSTLAMHVVANLLDRGFAVAVLDLDTRQRTLYRYLENRVRFAERHGLRLPMPTTAALPPAEHADLNARQAAEAEALAGALARLRAGHDFVVVDCPGSDTHLSRLAHAEADTLVTPVNDSFIDLDLLGRVDPDSYQVTALSHYAEMVWEARKRRSLRGAPALDWVVTRNRLAALQAARNMRRVDQVLQALRQRLAFRYVPGFTERVIYRELFPKGLTLVDFLRADPQVRMTISHVAARQEMRAFMDALRLPGWAEAEAGAERSPRRAGGLE